MEGPAMHGPNMLVSAVNKLLHSTNVDILWAVIFVLAVYKISKMTITFVRQWRVLRHTAQAPGWVMVTAYCVIIPCGPVAPVCL